MHIGHDHGMGGTSTADNDKAVCPVMDMEVNKKQAESDDLARTLNGQKVYLCCKDCAELFDTEPEKYAEKHANEK